MFCCARQGMDVIMGKNRYTCSDYRKEMILLGLKIRLNSKTLSDEDKKNLIIEIEKLTSTMDMD